MARGPKQRKKHLATIRFAKEVARIARHRERFPNDKEHYKLMSGKAREMLSKALAACVARVKKSGLTQEQSAEVAQQLREQGFKNEI